MNATIKNILIGSIASIVTIMIAFIGAWVQINSRIAVLEVQVSNDHEQITKVNQDIDEMKTMLQDIQVGVQHLQDVKKDK